jgi:hypothetical protein
MKAATKVVTLEQTGYTKEQLSIVFEQLKGYPPPPFGMVTIFWVLSGFGNRFINIWIGDEQLELPVTHTTLLQTTTDFQNAFREVVGEDPPLNEVLVKLAIYDVKRTLKWPLVAYYQSKISELANF